MRMLMMVLVMVGLAGSAIAAEPEHKAALRAANEQFIVAFEKCEDAATMKDRNKCRGAAKTAHTKAVQKADKAAPKK